MIKMDKKTNNDLFAAIRKASKLLDKKSNRYYKQCLYSDGLEDSNLFCTNGMVLIKITSGQNIPMGFYYPVFDNTGIMLIPETEYQGLEYPDTDQIFAAKSQMLFSGSFTKDKHSMLFCDCINKFYAREGKPIAFDYKYMDFLLPDYEYNIFIDSNNSPIQFLSYLYSMAVMPFCPKD